MVRCNAVKSNTNANNKNEQVLSQMCSNIKKGISNIITVTKIQEIIAIVLKKQ